MIFIIPSVLKETVKDVNLRKKYFDSYLSLFLKSFWGLLVEHHWIIGIVDSFINNLSLMCQIITHTNVNEKQLSLNNDLDFGLLHT